MISPIRYANVSFKGNEGLLSAREAYDKKTQDNDNIAKDAAKKTESAGARISQIPVEGSGQKLDVVA